MIDDIVFDTESFILETPSTVGGTPQAYSLDGGSFDATTAGGETSVIFIG